MMLKLDSVSEPSFYSLDVDEYSPLRVEFEPRVLSLDEIYYWRSTNKTNLLEVKLHALNGAVAEINLVLIAKERIVQRKSVLEEIYGEVPEKKGLPHFQLLPWIERIGQKEIGIDPELRFYDEDCQFKFFISDNGVAILFDGFVPNHAVADRDVRFLFDSEMQLCGIAVEDEKAVRLAHRFWL